MTNERFAANAAPIKTRENPMGPFSLSQSYPFSHA